MWEFGRQGGGYQKLKLFISKRLMLDIYLLFIPAGCFIRPHVDPVEFGFCHHRVNICWRPWKSMGILGQHTRLFNSRVIKMRPDRDRHWAIDEELDRYVLSIGWKTHDTR